MLNGPGEVSRCSVAVLLVPLLTHELSEIMDYQQLSSAEDEAEEVTLKLNKHVQEVWWTRLLHMIIFSFWHRSVLLPCAWVIVGMEQAGWERSETEGSKSTAYSSQRTENTRQVCCFPHCLSFFTFYPLCSTFFWRTCLLDLLQLPFSSFFIFHFLIL